MNGYELMKKLAEEQGVQKRAFIGAGIGEAAALWGGASLLGKLGLGAAGAATLGGVGYGLKRGFGALSRKLAPWRAARGFSKAEAAFKKGIEAATTKVKGIDDQIANLTKEFQRLKGISANNPTDELAAQMKSVRSQIDNLQAQRSNIVSSMEAQFKKLQAAGQRHAQLSGASQPPGSLSTYEQQLGELKALGQPKKTGFFHNPWVKWGLLPAAGIGGGLWLGSRLAAQKEQMQPGQPVVQQPGVPRW